MAAPALRIPLSLDMQGFERGIDKAKTHTRQATQAMMKEFLALNAQVAKTGAGLALSGGAAAGALALAGRLTLAVGAAKLLAAGISNAREQLADMVKLADRSQNLGVSPVFLQAFTASAKGAEDRVEQLEDALGNAFQALKPVLNPDWSVWDQGLTKVTAVEQAMRSMRELFSTDQNSNGLDLFRAAGTQDEKIRAALAFMIQLKNIGQEVAALDLAEKMFGRQFADNVRQGKESIVDLYNTIERKIQKPDVTNELVKEAKELDQRLTDAWHTISNNLTPSWNNLAVIMAGIKGAWVDVVELIAKATSAAPAAMPSYQRQYGFDPDRNPNDPNTPALPRVNVPTTADRTRQNGQSINAAGLDAWSSLNDLSGSQPAAPAAERIPLPQRRPNDIPEIKEKTQAITEQFDAIERLVNGMQRANDIMQVEYDTLGKSASARERGIAMAKAEAAARAAGRDLTQQEREEILKLADAYAGLKDRMEAARPMAQFAEEIGNINRQMGEMSVNAMRSFEGGLIGMINGTKTFKDAFREMAASIVQDLIKIAIRQAILAPLMAMLGGGGGGMGGGLFGGLMGLFGGGGRELPNFGTSAFIGPPAPGFAGGGFTGAGGKYQPAGIVHRGEYVMDAATTSRIGVSNLDRLRGYAEGGFVGPSPVGPASVSDGGVTVPITVQFSGTASQSTQEIAKLKAELPSLVVKAVQQGKMNRDIR